MTMAAGKVLKITGKVIYLELEGGIWGVIDSQGREWLPVNLPDELMEAGIEVALEATLVDDFFAGDMWGTAIELQQYSRITS